MKVHFISIGGSVMHQLAIALHRKGYTITGTDDEIFEPSKSNLEKEGLLPTKTGWDTDTITPDLDAIILGMHAKNGNPEIEKAISLGLPIYSFPEYIYQESKNKIRVAVGGSHGKTTTTSMILHVLNYAQKKFDYLVGARLEGFDQSVNITDAPVIICEADEYPASAIEKRPKFHFLFPQVAILTGIAWDHINVFPTFENYLEQFKIFIQKIESDGLLIYNQTDEILNKLILDNFRIDLHYQPYDIPTYNISGGVTRINIEGAEGELKVFGNHNLLNLHAAWYVCKHLQIDPITFVNAICTFTGASKRLEKIVENGQTIVYRDFAHAPSKVKATIEAVHNQFTDRKLIAVLELHTFSSLNENFMSEYKGSLELADSAIVFYSSHSLLLKGMPELKREIILDGFNKKGLSIVNKKADLQEWLLKQNYNEANLVLMSSGNFDGLDINNISQKIISQM